MKDKVLKYIQENNMLNKEDSVILGVSGGADSLCLLICLNELKEELALKLTVVHINHHIRGAEADEDQHFVEKICKKLGVECLVFHIDAGKLSREMKCSEEEAGRAARYNIFEQVRSGKKADHIAVAHNMNDTVETMLFNMARGTGIQGMAGISPVRGCIIRPLLCLERREIEEYVKLNNYEFRIDSTNLTDDYSRNKIRNNIIPYFNENINSNAMVNMARAGGELAQINEFLSQETDKIFQESVKKVSENSFEIDNSLAHINRIIGGRVIRKVMLELVGKLKDITRIHIEQVLDLYDNNVGKQVSLPYGVDAIRIYDGIRIYLPGQMNKHENSRVHVEETSIWQNHIILQNDSCIKLEYIENKGIKPEDLMYTKLIDCDKIRNNLVVRNRQPGDYITIDRHGEGITRKKLKQFFIDEKIPREKRDDIVLVADGQHIVWVLGYRLSAYYKIGPDTVRILKMECKKDGGQN